MKVGLVGRKCGMTRVFTDQGASVPVTVIHVENNMVTQVKNIVVDGYNAIQITSGHKKASRINKATAGHFAKANVEPGRGLWEFRVEEETLAEFPVGTELKVDAFKEGDMVNVQGVTKGRGFAGVIKRWNFAMQDATHGNSRSHRAPGSIGQNQSPGKVFKGKKMAGHMGDVTRTSQSLRVIKVDAERNLLMVKGSVAGAPGGNLVVTSSVKHSGGAK
ncbi:MAG: 50S ribosomal protein L3 [Gammaproteobacteria bacterium]|nr:50S ribosomal protein L3 [Gammaproteobacteria bacterium]